MRLHSVLLFAAILTMPTTHAQDAQDALAMSGEALFQRYCSACHGVSGLGDGPVSRSLSVEVPDLTLLTRRHNGTFPRELVERIIDGRHIFAAHGTRTMPVWGEELGNLGRGNPDAERGVRAMIDRLTLFVGSLQRAVAGAAIRQLPKSPHFPEHANGRHDSEPLLFVADEARCRP